MVNPGATSAGMPQARTAPAGTARGSAQAGDISRRSRRMALFSIWRMRSAETP